MSEWDRGGRGSAGFGLDGEDGRPVLSQVVAGEITLRRSVEG
jgi:hypothetical protein